MDRGIIMKYFGKIYLLLRIFLFLIMTSPLMAATAQYTYDNLNRLIQVQYDDGTVIKYTYDAVGNRLSELVTAFVSYPPPAYQASPASTQSAGLPADLPVIQNSQPSSSGGVTASTTRGVLELPAFFARINAAESAAEVDRWGQEFFDLIDRFDLSPEDRANYKKQADQVLEAKAASLKDEARGLEGSGEKGTSRSVQEAEAGSPADRQAGRIRKEGDKIYTVPAAEMYDSDSERK